MSIDQIQAFLRFVGEERCYLDIFKTFFLQHFLQFIEKDAAARCDSGIIE